MWLYPHCIVFKEMHTVYTNITFSFFGKYVVQSPEKVINKRNWKRWRKGKIAKSGLYHDYLRTFFSILVEKPSSPYIDSYVALCFLNFSHSLSFFRNSWTSFKHNFPLSSQSIYSSLIYLYAHLFSLYEHTTQCASFILFDSYVFITYSFLNPSSLCCCCC